jgi:hypothetical protein
MVTIRRHVDRLARINAAATRSGKELLNPDPAQIARPRREPDARHDWAAVDWRNACHGNKTGVAIIGDDRFAPLQLGDQFEQKPRRKTAAVRRQPLGRLPQDLGKVLPAVCPAAELGQACIQPAAVAQIVDAFETLREQNSQMSFGLERAVGELAA